jgi:ribosomal protein S18 acetylase RimI-like enzyme
MNINFRAITNIDFPFLKKAYRSTREHELASTGWTEEEKSNFTDFQFNAQHAHYSNAYKGAEFNIIEWNKKDIGRLYLWETESEIRIVDITLLPEYRKRGIGTKILNDLIKKSNKTCKKLNIHVEYNNPALKLYERLGFKKIDDTGVYYFMERLPICKA